jgi:hypothetical protein
MGLAKKLQRGLLISWRHGSTLDSARAAIGPQLRFASQGVLTYGH